MGNEYILMGVTASCYDTDKLNEKYAELNEKYQSEHAQKKKLLTKIQESTKKYDELNEKYEKEIVQWQNALSEKDIAITSMNISDNEKNQKSDHETEKYKQQINELKEQISLLTQQIKPLQIEKEKEKKKKRVSFGSTVPVPVNDEMIISALKLEVRDLKRKLGETVPNDNNLITPGTQFMNTVLKRYQTPAYVDDKDSDGDGDDDESDDNESLDEHEKIKIAQIIKKRKDDAEEIKKEIQYCKQSMQLDKIDINAASSDEEIDVFTPNKNLFHDSEQWKTEELANLKKEMSQQMVHLMKEAMSSDNMSQTDQLEM